MSKATDRRNNLIELFKSRSALSLEEIMKEFQVSKRTVQGDMEALKAMGYSVSVPRTGEHKGLYVLKKEEGAVIYDYYDEITGLAGDMLILLALQDSYGRKRRLTHDELYRELRQNEDLSYEHLGSEYEGMYGDRSPWYKKAIERLKSARCIKEKVVEGKGGKSRIYELDINAPRLLRTFSESDSGDELNILDILDVLSDYFEEKDTGLSSIHSKLQLFLDGEETAEESNYIRRERWSDETSAMDQIKSKLIKYPYMTKAIEVVYAGRGGKTKRVNIKVGMLIFSRSINGLYMIGEGTDSKKIITLLVDSIVSVRELPVKNDVYDSSRYRNIIKYMFGASGIGNMKEVVEVEVEFEAFGNVMSKVESMVEARRKNGARPILIENKEAGTVTYKDSIYNISDINVFLRGFGSACKVIKPEQLRWDMINSCNVILEQYKKEGYEV